MYINPIFFEMSIAEMKKQHWDFVRGRRDRTIPNSNPRETYGDRIRKLMNSYKPGQYLGNLFITDLEDITCGDFHKLVSLRRKYWMFHISEKKIKKDPLNYTNSEKELFKIADDIRFFLNYDGFKTAKNWNVFLFFQKLNVLACPYCNCVGLTTTSPRDAVRPQLDHFFPQAKNPIFSCSLFNMIPACSNCNSIKSDEEKKIIYPYKFGYDQYGKFSLRFKRGVTFKDCIFGKNAECFVKVDKKSQRRNYINNSLEVFNTEAVYNSKKTELTAVIKSIRKYNDVYRNFCYKVVGKFFPRFVKTKDDFLRSPDYSNGEIYPMKKIKEDLFDEFHR
jgi:hypothetical protein